MRLFPRSTVEGFVDLGYLLKTYTDVVYLPDVQPIPRRITTVLYRLLFPYTEILKCGELQHLVRLFVVVRIYAHYA